MHRSYAWTTLAALALVTVLTLVFTVQAVAGLVTVGDAQTVRESALGVNQDEVGAGRGLTSGLTLTLCVLTTAVALGIGMRRQGSRHAGIVLFLLLGVVSLGSSLAGLTADPPADNAWLGALNGVACLATCAMLLHPRTAADFDRAEVARRASAHRSSAEQTY
jgi:hypothetical protein